MSGETKTSVVIPAYGKCEHLPVILDSMKNGSVKPDEIIISHSGDHPPWELMDEGENVSVIHSETRLLAGAARNRGADKASGEVIAFCDADVVPDANWLRVLVGTLAEFPDAFVVGAVGVARKGGYWGMSTWLCEFSEQAPWNPAREQTGGASCNMALRTADFETTGGFNEDHQPGEDTVLFRALREGGKTQRFEPAAVVSHFNIAGFASFRRHQFKLGINAGRTRSIYQMRGSAAVKYPPLALLLWIPRTYLIFRRTIRRPGNGLVFALFHMPAIKLGTIIWTAGFIAYLRNPKAY